MKIPEQIKLGGHTIKIEFANTAHIDNKGTYNDYHNLIRLEKEKDTPEDNLLECFLHEIFEIINKKNNLDINHTVLSVISECIFPVFRDNKLTFYKE